MLEPFRNQGQLSSDFNQRLRRRLELEDARRKRLSMLSSWRWLGLVLFPLIGAACWAALPWTFGVGARALIGFASYATVLTAVAGRLDTDFLGYLGLSALPRVVDVLLFLGVVSWLMWASRAAEEPEEMAH